MNRSMPMWEQRVRAIQLRSSSLLGPSVSWAADVDRGVLLANPSGLVEVHAFDATQRPAVLRQVTSRPQGTVGAAITPDGEHVLWFDDCDGDEIGRWVQQPFDGGAETVMLPELPPAFGEGIVPLRGGGAVIGRATDDGYSLAVASADGRGRVAYESADYTVLADADGNMAAIRQARNGAVLHPVAMIVDLDAGEVVAELADKGKGLKPVGFSPAGDGRVLVSHSRHDRDGLLLWSPSSGTVEEITVELDGDLSGSWLPDASGLLLVVLRDGRRTLHRLDFGSGTVEDLPTRPGFVDEYSPRRDGSVHALVESSSDAAQLVEVGGDPIVVLPGELPAASVAAEPFHVEGPAGRVHSFLHRPRVGAEPFPTVFFVHGGPTYLDCDAFSPRVAALTDAGYAVVRVNYRGSTGFGQKWRDALITRLGAIEMEDIVAVRNHLEANGVIDPARVAIAGGSWGGYVTLYALGVEPERWAAGVALVPVADFAIAQEDQPPSTLRPCAVRRNSRGHARRLPGRLAAHLRRLRALATARIGVNERPAVSTATDRRVRRTAPRQGTRRGVPAKRLRAPGVRRGESRRRDRLDARLPHISNARLTVAGATARTQCHLPAQHPS